MKRLALLTALLAITMGVWAGKAKPGLRTNAQSDGTTIEYILVGDEDFHYSLSTDGVVLLKKNGTLYIAEIGEDGSLEATSQIAHEKDLRDSYEQALASKQNKASLLKAESEARAKAAATRSESLSDDGTLFSHTGSPKAVVLLIQFNDTEFTLEDPYSTFDKYLNYEDYFTDDDTDMGMTDDGYSYYRNYGSVVKYFEDMSFGQYTPQFDLYGPYTLAYPSTYFAGTSNMRLLLTAACSAANDDVNFSDYDDNDDGYIDLVYLIYAGYAQSITGDENDIWPNSGTISATNTFDGKKIRRYGVNNELNLDDSFSPSINGIGLFCHEFSHCLGLPDLYPSNSGTTTADSYCNQNPEYWDLMDAGEYTLEGYRPTPYTAWERERFGWMEITEIDEAADLTLEPLNEEGSSELSGQAYRIRNTENEDEYYILENIQNEGWSRDMYGHGMTVMHVDYDDDYFQLGDMPNSVAAHPRMTIIPADKLVIPMTYIGTTVTSSMSTYSETLVERYVGSKITSKIYLNEFEGDPFPGTYEVTSLTDDTDPASVVFTETGDNPGYMGKPITDITETDGIISFKFMGGTETGIKSINSSDDSSEKIFSIDGIYKGNDKSSLGKGIYIIGGKKFVVG